MTRHPGAWLLWAISAVLVASSSVHPVLTLGTLGVALVVALSFSEPGARGPLRLMLSLGIVFISIRVLLFTLTGRAGNTTLVSMPELKLPAFLGGLRLGGDLNLEVFATELADGARLLAILAVTGALVTVTDVSRLVRLLPRVLRHAGLVVQIAISFIPSLADSAREVREAQAARGIRVTRIRGSLSVVLPVLSAAVDRAFALAETLASRGFERATWLRYRIDSWAWRDTVMASGGLVGSIAAILVARSESGAWTAYPVASWPQVEPMMLLPLIMLATPVAMLARRDSPAWNEVPAPMPARLEP